MKFEKVSFEQFCESSDRVLDEDNNETYIPYSAMQDEVCKIMVDEFYKLMLESYKKIKLPQRATKSSAGYDFYAPYDFTLNENESLVIRTGVRIEFDAGLP